MKTIKKEFFIDEIIWALVLMQIMIGNMFKLTNILSLFILFFIIISCCKNLDYYLRKDILTLVHFILIVLIYPFFSFFLNGGKLYTLLNNVFYIITPMAMLLYISMCCNRKKIFLRKKFLKLDTIFNLWAIINFIVIVIQFIENKRLYSNEIAYKDSVSGLFGIYGIPILTLYICYIISYDLVLAKCKIKPSYYYIISVLIIVSTL